MDNKEIKKFINEFINDCLQGDINKLKNFSFEKLKGDKVYGCSSNDYDDTK